MRELIKIAIKNGWVYDKTHSLNDLILNFEEGEMSFIDALCSIPIDIKYGLSIYPSKEKFLAEWVKTPTSKREELLLITFKHLLE